MSSEQKSKTKPILIGVGIGCLALMGFCCLSAGGGVWYTQSQKNERGRQYAQQYLRGVRDRNEFTLRRMAMGAEFNTDEEIWACLDDTALGDMTGFDCPEADATSELGDDTVSASCTIRSASRGEVEATVWAHADYATGQVGFIWFADDSAFGARWRSDDCSSFSGREYFRDPPPGRVRP